MQTTLDKFYRKSRGNSSGLGNRLSLKGPVKKLFVDEPVESKPYNDSEKCISQSSSLEIKSDERNSDSSAFANNICVTPTKLSAPELLSKKEIPLEEIGEDDKLPVLPDEKPRIEIIPSTSTSECESDNQLVLKTPSCKLVNDDTCSTPTRSPATQTVLRKQLRLGEYSKLIRDSKICLSKKRRIDGLSDSETSPTEIRHSLNDIYGSPKLKKFDMVQLEVTSPVKRGKLKPRRLFGSSVISSPKKDISYVSPSKLLAEGPIRSPQPSPLKRSLERVDFLLAEGKEALVLPRKYIDLEETFHWIETIIKIRINRKELVTFNAIRNDVQKATGRRFGEEHLGKIKAVFPNAYILSRELVKVPLNRERSYELIIKFPDNSISTDREKTFHNLLLERTKLHHQEFLQRFDPSLQISANEVKRWHREFNLNDVPDIEVADIPQPPNNGPTALSVRNILEKSHAIVSGNKRLERAMSTLSEDKSVTETPNPPEPVSPVICKKTVAMQKALKGVSPALLEKIRAKQIAKHAQDITRTPAAAKEAIMLSRLPEIAKILRVVFVKEKKSILPEELVLQVVGQSFREKMSPKDLKEHFELLSKHLPGWMNSCKVENKPYVRLSKDADMTRILGRLQKLIDSS